jgi:fatty acid desaturase
MRLRVEVPTWLALLSCYALFLALTVLATDIPYGLGYVFLTFLIAFHSSLQHEAIHGHPTSYFWLNTALVLVPLGLAYPYLRYRATHLAHHQDARLTDPYDDPESWYVAPAEWARTSPIMRAVLLANNCLLGRILIGPALGFVRFVIAEIRLILSGRSDIALAWGLHSCAAGLLVGWLAANNVSAIGYGLACYGGLSLISIRSFLEHRADERVRGRSAVVEDGGFLSFLFLNNNLHAVHHAHPETPWYALPALYRQHRERFIALNGGYVLPSYWTVLRQYGLVPKESVAHPLMGPNVEQMQIKPSAHEPAQ